MAKSPLLCYRTPIFTPEEEKRDYACRILD